MGSPVRIAVLSWSDILAEYALFLLMTYLTGAWKLNFRHAAAIVNVFWGMIGIMPIFLKLIMLKTKISDRWMVLLCSLAYTIGLGLLSLSTTEKVSRKIDSADAAYKSVAVGQKTMFYTSLPLLVVAKSGYAVSLGQLIDKEKSGLPDTVIHYSMSIGAIFLVHLVGIAINYVIKEWLKRFGIPALSMVVATLIFSTGFSSYGPGTNEPSFLTRVSHKVDKLLKYVLKIFGKILLCPFRKCRVLPCCCSKFDDQQPVQNNDSVLNEETKFIISLFPICLLGLVSSLGNTYFLEQAYSMDRKIIGPLKFPLVTLLATYKLANFSFPKFYFDFADYWLPSGCKSLKRALNRIGMAFSLLYALLCCIIAAKVESRRLNIVKSHALQDSNKPVPMNLIYLVPQFFLLGGFYGMAYESIERFFKDCEIPDRMKPYMVDSAVGVFGLGNIGSVLLVYLVQKCTTKGEGASWFDKTLNQSHLDKYYWLLSIWTAINLVWYLLVVVIYPPKEKSSTEAPNGGEGCFNSLIKLAKKYCICLKCLPERFPCRSCCCFCCSSGGSNGHSLDHQVVQFAFCSSMTITGRFRLLRDICLQFLVLDPSMLYFSCSTCVSLVLSSSKIGVN